MKNFPENVIAIFTSVCHYRCRFCSNRLHIPDQWHWSLDEIKRLDPLWDHAKILNISGCGEVVTLPFFDQLMEYLDTKPGRICISTNGHRIRPAMLRQSRLREIVISLHSLIPETYDELTGTKGLLPTVLKNTAEMMAKPHDYNAVIVAVMTEKNVREAPAIARFALDVGADEARFLPLADPVIVGVGKTYDEDIQFHETPENLASIAEANKIMGAKNKTVRGFLTAETRREVVRRKMHTCQSPSGQIVIGMDGTVQPCCFIPPTCGFGNVLKQPWEDVWEGEKYETFRQQVREGTCELCLEHCKNWG